MSSHGPPMQPNEQQRNNMPQQPFNQRFFQFPSMWQQQGQFIFPSLAPFPNNIPPNDNGNNNSSGQYQWQTTHSSKKEGENNKMSYERHPNQEQYASYPEGATYRRASGPGWQQQEVYYPANSFK